MSRLYLRLFVLIGGLFLILTATMLAFVYTSDSRQVERVGLWWADTLNRLAFETLYAAMREGGGRAGNQEVIARLQALGAFQSIRVVKGDPVVRQFGATPDELPQSPEEQLALQGTPVRMVVPGPEGTLVLRTITPLFVTPECQRCHQAQVGAVNGAIVTDISLTPFIQTLKWRRNVLLVVIVSGLFTLAWLTLYGLRVTVLRPLEGIAKGVQALAQGDLSHRIHLDTGDEFEDLAQAFNQMAQRLQDTYAHLQESQARIQAAIEASRNPIWVSDAERRIIMVNRALERMVGRSREELLGRTCRYLFGVTLENGRSICDATCPLLGKPTPKGRLTGYMPTASGKDAWVEITYGYVRDREGRITGVIHVIHDLSEYKELERLKDEFLSLVSHELRTPLHHIKGFASTLLQPDVTWDPETQRDFLESINQEVDRLTDLVDKILHLSRLRSGTLPMQKRWWAVEDVLQGALNHCRCLLQREITLDVPDDLPPVWMDGREIETVLRNLLENAAKFSPPESPIVLGVRYQPEENMLHFWVQDQGPGIPPEEQERIFEHFYRGRGQRHSPGTGLGLAICKRIVEAHGGRIWVESATGQGACFHFVLPIGAPDEEAESGMLPIVISTSLRERP